MKQQFDKQIASVCNYTCGISDTSYLQTIYYTCVEFSQMFTSNDLNNLNKYNTIP